MPELVQTRVAVVVATGEPPGIADREGLARRVAVWVVAIRVLDRATAIDHSDYRAEIVHEVVVGPRRHALVDQLARVGARVVDRGRRAYTLCAQAQSAEHAGDAVDLHTICLRRPAIRVGVVRGGRSRRVYRGGLVLLVDGERLERVHRLVARAIVGVVCDDVPRLHPFEQLVGGVVTIGGDAPVVDIGGEPIARAIVGIGEVAGLHPRTVLDERVGHAVERVIAIGRDEPVGVGDAALEIGPIRIAEIDEGACPLDRLDRECMTRVIVAITDTDAR